MDLEAAKTSLLCKWIVKAMEPNEIDLQLMLRYRLPRFKSQRGSWRVSLDWINILQHQGFSSSKVWSHISTSWKVMMKDIYQLPPPAPKWNRYTRTFGGLKGWNLSIMGSLTPKPSTYTTRVSITYMIFGTMNT